MSIGLTLDIWQYDCINRRYVYDNDVYVRNKTIIFDSQEDAEQYAKEKVMKYVDYMMEKVIDSSDRSIDRMREAREALESSDDMDDWWYSYEVFLLYTDYKNGIGINSWGCEISFFDVTMG